MAFSVLPITHFKHKLGIFVRSNPNQRKGIARKDKFRSKGNPYDIQAHQFCRVFSVTAD